MALGLCETADSIVGPTKKAGRSLCETTSLLLFFLSSVAGLAGRRRHEGGEGDGGMEGEAVECPWQEGGRYPEGTRHQRRRSEPQPLNLRLLQSLCLGPKMVIDKLYSVYCMKRIWSIF